MKKSNIFNIALIALGAAIIAVLSPLALPIGIVPITLQTLAVGLIATVLKWRETFFAILLYIILGAIGLPVFPGYASGFAVLIGPTGGFFLAFVLVGTLISFLLERFRYQITATFVVNILCHLLMLLIGTIWLKFIMQAEWSKAFALGFSPFIIVEIVKAVLATFIGLAILRALQHRNDYFANNALQNK